MPYMHISVTRELTQEQKQAIKTTAGQMIEILPGKQEKGLMIRIDDGQEMYFRGAATDCAYIGICLFQMSLDEKKGEFARVFSQAFAEIAGIDPLNIYLSYSEYGNWFSNGIFK